MHIFKECQSLKASEFNENFEELANKAKSNKIKIRILFVGLLLSLGYTAYIQNNLATNQARLEQALISGSICDDDGNCERLRIYELTY